MSAARIACGLAEVFALLSARLFVDFRIQTFILIFSNFHALILLLV